MPGDSGYSGQCGRSIWTYTRTLRILRIPASTFLLYYFYIAPNHSILYLGYGKRPCTCFYWAEMAKRLPRSSTSSGRGLSPPSPPPRELRPRHRPGKEPAGSSSQARPSRQAPYMMASMPNPPARANPSRRGIAADISRGLLPA
jgi:hypothetical protein